MPPPEPIRFLINSVLVALGGFMTINVVSAAAFGAFRLATEEKRKKSGLPCGACRGKGFYICKVCKGDATIKWSPLYDPVCINPCLCPTCDGHRLSNGTKMSQLLRKRILVTLLNHLGSMGPFQHSRTGLEEDKIFSLLVLYTQGLCVIIRSVQSRF
ncbi:hypothetical protein HID58_026938 [Brassica napus]|uniref:Uncharacterized protein n=1 Tax=Brassica napus TaxID=3708 RepID=A0ABQ8CQG6_BRANA|nr:hypothetical protein HID58_026938 [Brassica napus]